MPESQRPNRPSARRSVQTSTAASTRRAQATNRPSPSRTSRATQTREMGSAQTRRATSQRSTARPSARTTSTRTQARSGRQVQSAPSLPIVPIIIGLVVVIALVVFVFSRCSAASPANTASSAQNTNTVVTNTAPAAPERPTVDELVAALPDVIDDDDKQALAERAQTDDDALWIAQHADEYDFIDSYIQWKMLRLAAYEGDSVDFVRHVMDRYPAAEGKAWSGTLGSGVPHLYQWDTAWADTEYCGLPFGMSGCCPTAFSMVAMALTGSTECTPYVAGVDAMDHGYAIDYVGSDGSFFTNRCDAFGFSCYSTGMDGDGLISALKDGALVVCNVGPGDFTVGGHFIVATGIADNGEVIVNDPYSTIKSAKTWDADRIANQTQIFYVCSK